MKYQTCKYCHRNKEWSAAYEMCLDCMKEAEKRYNLEICNNCDGNGELCFCKGGFIPSEKEVSA